jgi:hypothetical protein
MDQDKIFNFIIILYIGFLVLYTIHPEPKVLYKKVF